MITFALKAVIYDEVYELRHGIYAVYNYRSFIPKNLHSRGKWSTKRYPVICESGWHVVLPDQIIQTGRANEYLRAGNEVWIVAVKGNFVVDNRKAAYAQIKFLTRITATNKRDNFSEHWVRNPSALEEIYSSKLAAIKKNPHMYGLTAKDRKEMEDDLRT